MKNINIYLILIALCSCSIVLRGQVTIGTLTPPNSFSALELANIGKGLRLNQLSNSEQDNLTAIIEASSDIELARGLLIFNTTAKQIRMWKNDTEKWVALPQSSVCVVVSSISIQNRSPLTLDEYGTDDLVLEAMPIGHSSSSKLYYEWFKDNVQVGRGKIYKVAKERVSFRDAGQYTVKVYSCLGTLFAETKISLPVSVTINEN